MVGAVCQAWSHWEAHGGLLPCSLFIAVMPLLGERIQAEELWFPGREVLLALSGTLPLCLLQRKLLLCGFVLVTFEDGLGNMLPEPAGPGDLS